MLRGTALSGRLDPAGCTGCHPSDRENTGGVLHNRRGLGAPIEKDARLSVIKRLSAARSKASQMLPIALSAPSGGCTVGQPGFAGIQTKLSPLQSPALLALSSFPAITAPLSIVPSPAAQTWCHRDTPPVWEKRHIFAMDGRGNCIRCGSSPVHPLHTNPQYRRLDVSQRIELVRTQNRCENCLAAGHRTICNENHHTTVHDAPRGAAAHTVVGSVESDGIGRYFRSISPILMFLLRKRLLQEQGLLQRYPMVHPEIVRCSGSNSFCFRFRSDTQQV